MTTAKDFTMRELEDRTIPHYAYAFEGTELWILDHISSGGTIESYVREYVKAQIAFWKQYCERETGHCAASERTIYRVWRSGPEFDEIVSYIKREISYEQAI